MQRDIDDNELDTLRADARAALERVRERNGERPFFFEFSGSPKSGKSTCIDIVQHFFRRVGFNVFGTR